MFDTVVIATDGSETATRSIEVALDLAGEFDAAVHSLCVVTPDGDHDRAREATERVARMADRPVTTDIRTGDPAAEICSYVAAADADLVALGTRGREGESFHLGSVAERVVEQCPVPVLTVRRRSSGGDAANRELL